jgi:hypothetical protein
MTPDFRVVVEAGDPDQGEASPVVRIAFPRAAAPDANAAMDQLFAAFPDHQPILLSESDDQWVFELRWTSDPATFVDPGVTDAATSLYGLALAEIGGYCEVHRWGGRDVVISMVHAWALLAPAMAIKRRRGKPLSWVVHVDDHTDLMAPMVEPLAPPGLLRDHIFGVDINVGEPDSVVAAVRRGLVSKGNFLTAYLLAYPGCRAVHVGAKLGEKEFPLSPEKEVFELGGKEFTRTGFLLTHLVEPATGAFRQTRSLPSELPMQDNDGVWLDIDLDYFCNRYDGDSDRRSKVAVPNEQNEVMRRVESFLAELSVVNWLPRIEAVSIAVSPGFFPSDHWAGVIPAVRDGIRRILGPLDGQ